MNFKINKDDLGKLIERFEKESGGLREVINPILEKYELEKKEVLEVYQIGKFVHKVDAAIRITEKPQPPSPDFIISYKNKQIGLEHTQILTDDAGRYFKIKQLLENSEKVFEKMYPNSNVHATISILNDKFDFKQSEKNDLSERIAEYVQWTLSETVFDFPDYITGIRTTKHSKVSFFYKEMDWRAEYLTRERLKEEIVKKEEKISNYSKSEFKLAEVWLTLLVGTLSSVSYELNEMENYKMESKFDRVYLMADFEEKIIQIK